MKNAKNVHIIGIGGIGTSAVAKWWLARGAKVSGSDMAQSEITDAAKEAGATIKISHKESNVPKDCDLVIYTQAIPESNSERKAAKSRGITLMSYPQFLGELAKSYRVIAVSGTHGKSTTTAMIAAVLTEAGLDPTVIVGTNVIGLNRGNVRIGEGDWFVVEACEYMASMLEIIPEIAVITNIEADHLDFYRDIDHIQETFQKWIDAMPEESQVFTLTGDEISSKLTIKNGTAFGIDARGPGEFTVGDEVFELQYPGEHNAINASAAVAVAKYLNIDSEVICTALRNFRGTWRRFEYIGNFDGADVYSDYAHHPTEINASLSAYRETFERRRIITVYEPHQHSRTHELFDDFKHVFDKTDVLILSEVYEVAGRTEEKYESSKDLADLIKKQNTVEEVIYAKDFDAVRDQINKIKTEGDVIIYMGAGAIDTLAREYKK